MLHQRYILEFTDKVIKIIALNVNGLNNRAKCISIFNKYLNKDNSIVILTDMQLEKENLNTSYQSPNIPLIGLSSCPMELGRLEES